EKRDHKAMHPCLMANRTQVLWQARATESKPGLQIRWGNIEFCIHAENFHYFVAINLHALAEITNFVGETNLEGMESVICIFYHFSHSQAGSDQGSRETLIDLNQSITGSLVEFPNDSLGRVVEVGNRRAFTQELRVHANPKINTDLSA